MKGASENSTGFILSRIFPSHNPPQRSTANRARISSRSYHSPGANRVLRCFLLLCLQVCFLVALGLILRQKWGGEGVYPQRPGYCYERELQSTAPVAFLPNLPDRKAHPRLLCQLWLVLESQWDGCGNARGRNVNPLCPPLILGAAKLLSEQAAAGRGPVKKENRSIPDPRHPPPGASLRTAARPLVPHTILLLMPSFVTIRTFFPQFIRSGLRGCRLFMVSQTPQGLQPPGIAALPVTRHSHIVSAHLGGECQGLARLLSREIHF